MAAWLEDRQRTKSLLIVSESRLLAEGLHGGGRAGAAEQRRGPVVGVVQVVVIRLQRRVDAAALLVRPHQRGRGAVQPPRHAAQHRHLLAGLGGLVNTTYILGDVHNTVEVVRLRTQVAAVEQEPATNNT